MTILDEIVSYKKSQLDQRPIRSLKTLLADCKTPLIIGEIKRGSPSRGLLKKDLNIKETLETYSKKGVGAISVLTDSKFFFGNYSDLAMVRSLTDAPILCKDFIIDVNQIMSAYRAGADCILLIASILNTSQIEDLIVFAHLLGLEVLLEIKSLDEFKRIKTLDFDILGINNRDLDTFETHLEVSMTLIQQISISKPIISESGFFNQQQVDEVFHRGFKGVLIGESLVTGQFRRSRRPEFIKICGVKDKAIIKRCHDEKATHVGFVLSESPRQISIDRCRELVEYTRKETELKSVAVIKEATHREVNTVLETINPDYVQVHRLVDDQEKIRDLHRLINVMTIDGPIMANQLDKESLYLCDTGQPGTGKSFDWAIIKDLKHKGHKIIVAGGITPSNVGSLVSDYQPFGVDVSSGVETDGAKDGEKIKQLIQNLKEN